MTTVGISYLDAAGASLVDVPGQAYPTTSVSHLKRPSDEFSKLDSHFPGWRI